MYVENRGLTKNTSSSSELVEIGSALGMRIQILDRVENFSRFVRPGCFCILNLQDRSEGGGTHWVSFMMDESRVVFYFDSFGCEPPERLSDYLLSHSNAVFFSDSQIQPLRSTSCGYYCLLYLRWMRDQPSEMRYRQYLDLFDAVHQRRSELKLFSLLNQFLQYR